MTNLFLPILGLTLLVAAISCASSSETKHTPQKDRTLIEIDNISLQLSDYLRRSPGVNVFGSEPNVTVNIRGISSFLGSNEPLFVVDGQRFGRSYSHVAGSVPVAQIASIKVLKGAEASGYGLEGGNGVIEITTKK